MEFLTGTTTKGLIAPGRCGDAGELAGLVAYLAGPEATFITGASVTPTTATRPE